MTIDDQLARLSRRGPVADPRFVVRRALQDAAPGRRVPYRVAGDPAVVSLRPPRRPRPRRLLAIAATTLLATGTAGLLALRDRDMPAAGSLPTAPVAPPDPAVPARRPLLSTPVPADELPWVALDLPGWDVDWHSWEPLPDVQPSEACPGCGAERLIVAADGPLLAGGLFTAWIVPAATALLDDLGVSMTIPGIGDAQFAASPPGTPEAQSWATWAFALGDGPDKPIVVADSRGLAHEVALGLVSALTWQEEFAIGELPPGFHLVETTEPAEPGLFSVNLTNGWDHLIVTATNRGLQGLLDWHYLVTGDLLGDAWAPRDLDGATVAWTWKYEDDLAWGTAAWVVGEWAFMVDGVRLSEDGFAEVVRALELTDAATFAARHGQPTEGEQATATGNGWATLRRFDAP